VIKIGVLALQGSVAEHIHSLSRLENVIPCEVKNTSDLNDVSGLILPGGESTTIGKLIREWDLLEPIATRAKQGMPLWGTCAGMILMAKKIVDEDYVHLGLMDISVRRNAYGSQLNSFTTGFHIPKVSNECVPLVFIRAPWVESIESNVEALATIKGRVAAVKQDNMLATAFHPELTHSLAFHRYFADIVRKV